MYLELQQVLTQIVAFLIMVWVLKKYAWQPILGLLNERKQLIQSEFDTIEEQKKSVAILTEEYNNKLHGIEAQSRKQIQEAIVKGREMAQEIEQETRAKAVSILNKAQAEVQKEIAEAKEQLKKDVVNLSMQAVEKIIGEKLDSQKDQKLIEESLQKAEFT
ncbi:MAG: F0F1 ATP synthase subunit B [Candidatus Protochlamydia sp.]|nr:F0F1 ATP synthase subunit B [Candidatus Protochlamydia sp.]